MTSDEKARILEKVVKCLNLANDKGANEFEAAQASATAQAILDRYNLSVADIPNLRKEEAIKAFYLWEQSRWQGWELHMFSDLARVFDCFPYLTSMKKMGTVRKSLSVVGFQVDVEVFKFTFEFLRKTVSDLGVNGLELAKKEGLVRSKKSSYNYKFSFCSGCSQRIIQKIKADRDARLKTEVKTKALVLYKKADIDKWVNANLKLGAPMGINLGYNELARRRGREAADGIQLNPAIKDGRR